MTDPSARLDGHLRSISKLTIAVSGGVDSLTLAYAASRCIEDVACVHAVSPAVSPSATDRVRAHADKHGWHLDIIDSGEFADPSYRANPHNRCYFCKSNLYGTMRRVVDGPIAAGTNTDDLGEYRPGLIAADDHHVVHPFVDVGLAKSDVRAIAGHFGLSDIAELPAQPCLASRITTGIAIEVSDLRFVDRVEGMLRKSCGVTDVRCRITETGVVIQSNVPLPEASLEKARQLCLATRRRFVGWQPYRRGSAFVVPIS
ncbi:adenine nucleotide alpha hydrolase [Roseobacter sp. YSTF-M11]|uniref:Adenine nucleotide alpha hydrolase n=1 Tax=Roseobacter insulae TaxID=2859783 RepID=A0A9X1FTZ1_9RHOB|nr:adenine nucleotide alpha hydrolase [Roseobacter insulae]MBW4707357.1 adenine nucleotide alpha hydrolase [Roseobacter insulae]